MEVCRRVGGGDDAICDDEFERLVELHEVVFACKSKGHGFAVYAGEVFRFGEYFANGEGAADVLHAGVITHVELGGFHGGGVGELRSVAGDGCLLCGVQFFFERMAERAIVVGVVGKGVHVGVVLRGRHAV